MSIALQPRSFLATESTAVSGPPTYLCDLCVLCGRRNGLMDCAMQWLPIISTMGEKASALAAKLQAEGERTMRFFRELNETQWQSSVFHDGAQWTVRGVLEHLIVSETQLQQLFEAIVRTGMGAPEGMNVDALNLERTGSLFPLNREDILNYYTSTRRATIEFAQTLTDEQLAIRARHPAIGESALEDQLKLIYLHHQMHVRDVKKALG